MLTKQSGEFRKETKDSLLKILQYSSLVTIAKDTPLLNELFAFLANFVYYLSSEPPNLQLVFRDQNFILKFNF